MFNIHVTHFQTVAFFIIMAVSGALDGMDLHHDVAFFQINSVQARGFSEPETVFVKTDPPQSLVKGNPCVTRVSGGVSELQCSLSFGGSSKVVSTGLAGGTILEKDCLRKYISTLKNNPESTTINFFAFLDEQRHVIAVMTRKMLEMTIKGDDMRMGGPTAFLDPCMIDKFISLSNKSKTSYDSAMQKIDTLYADHVKKNPFLRGPEHGNARRAWNAQFKQKQPSFLTEEINIFDAIIKMQEQNQKNESEITNNNSNKFPFYIALGGGICVFAAFCYYLSTKFLS